MYERFTDTARIVMQLANQEAQRIANPYIDTEHILVGIIKEGSGFGFNIIRNLGYDPRDLLRATRDKYGPSPTTGTTVAMGRLPHTPAAKAVIRNAIEAAQGLHHDYVGTEHLLLGLLANPSEGIAAAVLDAVGITFDAVRAEVVRLLNVGVDPEWAKTDGRHVTIGAFVPRTVTGPHGAAVGVDPAQPGADRTVKTTLPPLPVVPPGWQVTQKSYTVSRDGTAMSMSMEMRKRVVAGDSLTVESGPAVNPAGEHIHDPVTGGMFAPDILDAQSSEPNGCSADILAAQALLPRWMGHDATVFEHFEACRIGRFRGVTGAVALAKLAVKLCEERNQFKAELLAHIKRTPGHKPFTPEQAAESNRVIESMGEPVEVGPWEWGHPRGAGSVSGFTVTRPTVAGDYQIRFRPTPTAEYTHDVCRLRIGASGAGYALFFDRLSEVPLNSIPADREWLLIRAAE